MEYLLGRCGPVNPVTLLLELLAAAIGTVAFSVLFRVNPRHFPFCALVGAVGWLVYRLTQYWWGSDILATFLATLTLSACSRWFSTLRRTPTLVFLVSGIFTLVPGAAIYNTAYYVFMDLSVQASAAGAETLKLAGAIALGILVAYSLPRRLFGWRTSVRRNDN